MLFLVLGTCLLMGRILLRNNNNNTMVMVVLVMVIISSLPPRGGDTLGIKVVRVDKQEQVQEHLGITT